MLTFELTERQNWL